MLETLLASFGPKLIAIGVMVLGVLGIYVKVRSDGKAAARAEQARKDLETRNEMDKARADAPRDAGGVVERLRRGGF